MAKKRVRRTPGDIVSIEIGPGAKAFGLVLPSAIRFFDFLSEKGDPPLEEILKAPEAFTIWVDHKPIRSGEWPVLDHIELTEEQMRPLDFFKQDVSGMITIYSEGGNERLATKAECEGLECAAVWASPHVVDRLKSHFRGEESIWVTSMALR